MDYARSVLLRQSQGKAPRTPDSQSGAISIPLYSLDIFGNFLKQKRDKTSSCPDVFEREARALAGCCVPPSARAFPRWQVQGCSQQWCGALSAAAPWKVGLRSRIQVKLPRWSPDRHHVLVSEFSSQPQLREKSSPLSDSGPGSAGRMESRPHGFCTRAPARLSAMGSTGSLSSLRTSCSPGGQRTRATAFPGWKQLPKCWPCYF